MLRRALPFLIPALIAQAAFPALAQAPSISFDATHFDFGRITPDRKVTHQFKVTNTGNAILSITQVRPSCGCTSTVVGQWSVEPGKSTEVEATFDPHGYKGVVRKSLVVVSNDPANGNATLTFEAEVIPEIQASQEHVSFTSVTRGSSANATVRYSSGSGEPVSITKAEAPGADYLHLNVRQDGKDAVLDVSLDGRQVPKGKDGDIEVVTLHTSNPRMPVMHLNVVWQMRASVVATPSQVAWDLAPAGKEQRMKVELKQVDGHPFRVTGFSSTNPNLTVEGVNAAAAPMQSLVVVLSPRTRSGRYSERLKLATTDPEVPEISIDVTAVLK
ncbi:MAG TPA: DUF1573 domain-containing protein [Holophagaceae bacterium]|nr:DUF1573 domain-containing protein [Holophagaceae bacterium]